MQKPPHSLGLFSYSVAIDTGKSPARKMAKGATATATSNPLDLFIAMMPSLTPSLGALAITSLIILISNSFKGSRKIAFQAFFFMSGLSLSLTYLLVRKDEFKVNNFFRAFGNLPDELKLAFSVLVISASYFGGAMYIGGPSNDASTGNASDEMPASCDRAVTFDVPSKLPKDEKQFFELMFTKLTDEIIADLPTVYEMNGEAIDWIKHMIDYNAAGGKMNRGLAVVDVQNTFAKSKGTELDTHSNAHIHHCILWHTLKHPLTYNLHLLPHDISKKVQPCRTRNVAKQQH